MNYKHVQVIKERLERALRFAPLPWSWETTYHEGEGDYQYGACHEGPEEVGHLSCRDGDLVEAYTDETYVQAPPGVGAFIEHAAADMQALLDERARTVWAVSSAWRVLKYEERASNGQPRCVLCGAYGTGSVMRHSEHTDHCPVPYLAELVAVR